MLSCETLSVSCLLSHYFVIGGGYRENIPSERNIQARRKVNRFGNCLISLGLIMPPTLFHPWLSPIPPFTCSDLASEPLGNPFQAGMVNTAHQIALTPTASLNEEVVPPIKVTGMMRSARTETPDRNPRAVAIDEIREVVTDNKAL